MRFLQFSLPRSIEDEVETMGVALHLAGVF
jgi:hypothetical protein